MRIVVVEPRHSGGMVHYAYRLCDAMATAGHDVTLITSTAYELRHVPHRFTLEAILSPTSRPAGPQASGAGPLAAGWRRVRRALRLATGLRLVLTEWLRLARRLLELRPDVVQFGSIEHAIEAPFLWLLRARGLFIADVVHEPEIRTRRGWRWAADVRAYRLLYPAFRHIFLHGEANLRRFAELYPGVPAERLHAIQMGSHIVLDPSAERDVDMRARHGIPPGAPVVVFFGTLLPSKGLDDLLEAWVTVHARRPDAHLLICGHPSRHLAEGQLESTAVRLGLEDVVTVDPRYVPNEEIGALLHTGMVVVFPYRNATQSGALQMAYAYGRPVIVTRAGALREVVEEGRSGLVVDIGRPDQLATAILEIIDDPARAERMGARAKELSDTVLSWDAIAASVLSVYERAGAG